ncbi:WhiB family transcriptional regulator [Streptomyces tsukubensis]|uniref:WhiB family transcriptional regulator n=1 Tax=Streptomyces tsukubensis TaxID=83656 RepID=UPI0036A6ADBA
MDLRSPSFYEEHPDTPRRGPRSLQQLPQKPRPIRNPRPPFDEGIRVPAAVSGSCPAIAHAKSICSGCPVRKACFNSALEQGSKECVWGGTTEKERRPWQAKLHARLDYERVRAAFLGRDVHLSTAEREAVTRHAHRRADGAGTRRRFFADPKNPELDASDRALTETVLRTCRRIGVDPIWLHRGHCEVAQLGAGPAPLTDWMTARRLDVKILTDRGATL